MTRKDQLKAETRLRNSLCSICAYHQDKLVGMGRVVGDGAVYFMVVDLAVLPEYQGKGIGKEIMEQLMDSVRKNVGTGSFVSLFSNHGLAKYYEKFGFRVRETSSPGMSFMVTQ